MGLLSCWLVVLLAQAAPTTRAPAQPPPLSQALSPVVSAAAYGLTGEPGKDATEALEAALARAGQLAARPATSGSPPTALVTIPGGVHTLSRPLFVPTGVDLVGQGWSSRLDMAGDRRYPVLIYGITDPRVEPDDRPDLFGLLDRSAAPRPGVRRGWSTAGGRVLQGQFTSANIGRWHNGARDYWEGVEHFTLDVALVRPRDGWKPLTPLLGCGNTCITNNPQPWTLWTSPRENWVVLSLATETRIIGIATAMPLGRLAHLSWQINLREGTAVAWADGVQAAVELDGLAPGMRLKANSVWPLHIGRQGFAVATSSERPTAFTLAGLHLAAAPRYAVGRPGSRQTRRDGQPVHDAYRYFEQTNSTATVGFFPFDDPPGRRWLRWTPGDGLDEIVMVMRGAQGGGKPCRLADLAIWSRGPAVLLGAVLDWRASNLRLQSESAAAVGSIPLVMSYPITLSGCTLSGGDAALSLSQALVALRDCKIEGQGRDAIRLRGASLDALNTFAAFCPPQGRTFLRVFAGGEGDVVIRLDRVIVDFEDRGPADALFVIQPEPQHPTTVRITDLSAALTGPTHVDPRPVVVLERHDSPAPARCVIDGLASGKTRGIVGGGEGWKVQIDDAPVKK